MRSLRGRLSALLALGLFAVTAAATTGVVFERWQEDQSTLRDDVEFATFRLAEDNNPIPPTVSIPAGSNSFAVIFDAEARVIGASERLPNELITQIIEEIWSETTLVDVLVAVEFERGELASTAFDSDRVVMAGTACADPDVCDTVVVGTGEQSFGPYLLRRAGWIIGSALVAAALALFAARWLVGRSLRPVDRMRSELDRITASPIDSTDLGRRVPVPDSGDELTLLGQSMNGTLDRLGSAVSANERFVADAAHELRSPITGVKAALEVHRSKQPDDLLDDSIVELDRASRLVDDLLVLARRRSGASPATDVDLDDVVRTAVSHLRARRPELDIEASLAPCRVRGSEDDLRRVVGNVLDNAAHYGNGRLQISTAPTPEPGTVALRIGDNGPGIPVEQRLRVFERFARLDESRARDTGGTGLGLAIAKELIEDHGGTIQAGSSDLGGALFEVRLPG